jgi:orotidine-5'-phosphate decarboxylase
MAKRLRASAGLVKVGSQLFTSEGPRAVQRLANLGFGVFLDLKYHDIPNTVAGAVQAAAALPRVRMMTLHASGGLAMMRAAREALAGRKDRPALLGVTLLTSLDAGALRRIGIQGPATARVVALARLAKEAGLDGVVASAHEAKAIRGACGRRFLIVVPGIRPTAALTNDQARVATPADAIRAGANYLVAGRPITGASDPTAAAHAIVTEMAYANRK